MNRAYRFLFSVGLAMAYAPAAIFFGLLMILFLLALIVGLVVWLT